MHATACLPYYNRLSVQRTPQQANNLRNCGLRFCPSKFDSKDFLRGRRTKKEIYKRKARNRVPSVSISLF